VNMKTYQSGIRRMAKHERADLFARWDMNERGWTDGLIAKHLPTPDDYRDNQHYKKAAPQKYWLKARVELAEAQPEIAEALAKVLARRVAQKRAKAIQNNPTPEDFMTPERVARFASAKASLEAWRA